MKPLTIAQIAARIDAHFKRIEADPKLNPWNDGKANGTKPFYIARSHASGARIGVVYVSYQGTSYMKKVDALKYLEWLDAGNVGKHWKILP